jgi:hypothetical protein
VPYGSNKVFKKLQNLFLAINQQKEENVGKISVKISSNLQHCKRDFDLLPSRNKHKECSRKYNFHI